MLRIFKPKDKPSTQAGVIVPGRKSAPAVKPAPVHNYNESAEDPVDALFSAVGFDFDKVSTGQLEATLKASRWLCSLHEVNRLNGTPKPAFKVKNSCLWDHPAVTAYKLNMSQRMTLLNKIRFWRTHILFLYSTLAMHSHNNGVSLNPKREMMFALACGVEYCKDAITALAHEESAGMRIPQEYRTGVLEFDTHRFSKGALECAIQILRHYMKEQYEGRYLTEDYFEIAGLSSLKLSERWLKFFLKHQNCEASDGPLKRHWHERAKRLLPKVIVSSPDNITRHQFFSQAQSRALEWVEMVLHDKYIEMANQCGLGNVYGETYLQRLYKEFDAEVSERMKKWRDDWVSGGDNATRRDIRESGCVTLSIKDHPFKHKHTEIEVNLAGRLKGNRNGGLPARYSTSWSREKYPFSVTGDGHDAQKSNAETLSGYIKKDLGNIKDLQGKA